MKVQWNDLYQHFLKEADTCCPRKTERKFYIPSQTLFLVRILLQILLVSWNAR